MRQPVRPGASHLEAIRTLESALDKSRTKAIRLEINNALYELKREGSWFIFARLNKKRAQKQATLFDSLWAVYYDALASYNWRIIPSA